jgi:hypothetical protein
MVSKWRVEWSDGAWLSARICGVEAVVCTRNENKRNELSRLTRLFTSPSCRTSGRCSQLKISTRISSGRTSIVMLPLDILPAKVVTDVPGGVKDQPSFETSICRVLFRPHSALHDN